MNEVCILCIIMIVIEMYHFVFHNYIRATCQPFYDRVVFLSKFQKMKADFYAMRLYAIKRPSNKCIIRFVQNYDSKLDVIHQMFETMPSTAELIEKFIGRTSPSTIRRAIMAVTIEIIYLALFFRLLFLLPSGMNWRIGVVVGIFSIIHSINETGEQLKFRWYPMVDSLACMVIYACTATMYMDFIS